MLSEAYEKNQIGRKELILANLFNSLPTYFLHLPTVIVITLPFIRSAAFIYVGITFGAALLRTLSIVLVSRLLLPKPSLHLPAGSQIFETIQDFTVIPSEQLAHLAPRTRESLYWRKPW